MSYEDEDYFLPLEDQRVFGAGITKKRVPFVRSSDHELSTLASSAPATPASTGSSIANKYLSIVMKDSSSSASIPAPSVESETATPSASTSTSAATPDPPTTADSPTTVTDRSLSAPPQPTTNTNTTTSTTCEVCNLPLASSASTQDEKSHESSLAHQVCLTHSHPPSHLDRKSHGLRYLESYGWDPDSRLGLGAEGREGIRVPVKGKLKSDTVGLGAVVPTSSSVTKKRKEKVQKLNAKQVRKGHFDARRKGDKLRELFYQDDEVLRHLGKG